MSTEMNPKELAYIDTLKWPIEYPKGGIELSKGVNNRHLAGWQNHCLGLDGVSAKWDSADQELKHWVHC